MNKNSGIVFIHGAGLDGSIWDDLKPFISFPVLTIDLPNRNKGDQANSNLTFDDYTKSVIEQITKWNVKRIILVVHSIGGCVGLKVAEHFEKNLEGIIGISSIHPLNGHSFVSSMPFPQNILLPIILKLFGTKPPKASIKKELCNDLSPEQTDKIVNHFSPESRLIYTTKIKVKELNTNTLYIKLSNDNSLPMSLQDKMAKNLKAKKIVTFESGHLPMISKPKQLAEIINSFANKV